MYTAVVVFIIIVCLLLALAVLVQNAKGGGLAAGFGSSQQVMGVRKTTDFIEKFTWGLAGGLMVLALAANFMLPKSDATGTVRESSIQEQIDNATLPNTPAAAPLPGAQQQPAQQPAAPAK